MSKEESKRHLRIMPNNATEEVNEVDSINDIDDSIDDFSYEDYLEEQENYYYKLIKQKNNLWGIIKPEGGFAVPPVYDEIQPWVHGSIMDPDLLEKELKELPLRFVITKDGKYGIASEKAVLVEPSYDWIENYDYNIDGVRAAYFPAIKNKRTYYLDNDGNVIVDFDFEKPFCPVYSDLTFGYTKGGKFVVLNLKTKKIVYEDTYINVNFADANINPKRVMLKLNKGNKYIILDENGNIVNTLVENEKIKEYNITYLSDKVLMYSKEDEELGLTCGLADYKGNILTDLKYRTIKALLKPDYENNSFEYSDYLLCSPLVLQKSDFPNLPKLAGSMAMEIVKYNGDIIKSNMNDAFDMPAPNGYHNAGCLPIIYYENGKEKEWEG